jgi:hypothetical protein
VSFVVIAFPLLSFSNKKTKAIYFCGFSARGAVDACGVVVVLIAELGEI